MKNKSIYHEKRISIILASLIAITMLIPATTISAVSQIEAFVTRLYQTTLNREPDEDGLSYWSAGLSSGSMDGTKAAEAFISSEEMKNKGLSDHAYLNILYTALMDRQSDPGGMNYWQGYLQSGVSRAGILRQFLLSGEFQDICNHYGILAGDPQIHEKRDANINLTAFIHRQYKEILGRESDIGGINYWAEQILDNGASLEDVSGSFVFSKEFENKGYSNEEYIKCLYRAFMGREADEGGLAHWNYILTSGGQTRSGIFAEFAYSDEFRNIIISMGLIPSEKVPVPTIPEPVPNPTPAPSPSPSPVPNPVPNPGPAPAPGLSTPTAENPISITTPVARNSNATVWFLGKPNTRYSITVVYNSGESSAEGLENKTSDANGYISWTWKIGGRTAPGVYTATITDESGKKTIASFEVIT